MVYAALLVFTNWSYTYTNMEPERSEVQANTSLSYSGSFTGKRASADDHGVPPCSTQGGLSINIAHTS